MKFTNNLFNGVGSIDFDLHITIEISTKERMVLADTIILWNKTEGFYWSPFTKLSFYLCYFSSSRTFLGNSENLNRLKPKDSKQILTERSLKSRLLKTIWFYFYQCTGCHARLNEDTLPQTNVVVILSLVNTNIFFVRIGKIGNNDVDVCTRIIHACVYIWVMAAVMGLCEMLSELEGNLLWNMFAWSLCYMGLVVVRSIPYI